MKIKNFDLVLAVALLTMCRFSAEGAQRVSALPDLGAAQSTDVIGVIRSGVGYKKKIGDLIPPPASSGLAADVYISNREVSNGGDGLGGDGSLRSPFNGGTRAKFDAAMVAAPASAVIHLGPGTFTTNGVQLKEGWRIHGRGKNLTTVKLSDGLLTASDQVATAFYEFDFEGFLNYAEVTDLTIDCNRANQSAVSMARTFNDLTTANGNATATSLQANFTSADLHKHILSRYVPSSTYVGVVNSATSIGLSSSSSTNTPVNATGSATWPASIDGLNGYLNAVAIAAKSAKILNVRALTCYAVPGEGFPLMIDHDGTKNNADFAEITGCEQINPYGYMTAVMVYDQSATRTVADGVTTSGSATITSATLAFVAGDIGRTITSTNLPSGTTITTVASGTSATVSQQATASGSSQTFSILKGEIAGLIRDCTVFVPMNASGHSQGYGGRQWNHFTVKNNKAIGTSTGMTCDTDDFQDVEVCGNTFITNPLADLTSGQGVIFNGSGTYSNWRVHDNTITTSGAGSSNIVLSAGSYQIYHNTLTAGNSSYGALGLGTSTGAVYSNTITETPTSTIPISMKPSGNIKPDGTPLYTAISGKPQMVRVDGGSNTGETWESGQRAVFDFTNIRVDPASMANASTEKITVPAAGQIHLNFACNFSTLVSSSFIQVEISKNGNVLAITSVATPIAGVGYMVDVNDSCAANDYYQATVWNGTGSNATIDRDYQKTILNAEFVAD